MIEVGAPVADGDAVTADVGGAPVWFSSPDVGLAAAPEAFGSALLIPALHAGERLRLAGRADRRWRAGAARAAALVGGWWGYEPSPPRVRGRLRGARRREGVALCFTAGVDSFHSLLHGPRADVLLFVTGYDVALAEAERAARVERLIRDVAAAAGARAVIVRSNLREHPLVAGVNWERSHGGALAAAGHVVAGAAGTLLISSGLPRERARPWGSHWELDPLWSSSAMRVEHSGDAIWHIEKCRVIAHDALVQRHMRVCWEHRTDDLNCSRCDKCLITMVTLADEGRLADFATFDGPEVLPERLAALPHTRYLGGYGRLVREGLEPRLHGEVTALLARTEATVGMTHA